MWLPATTLAVLICLVGAHHHERRSSLVFALWVWLAGLALASPAVFSYRVDYLTKADLFMAACIGLTTAGFLLARRKPREAPASSQRRLQDLRVIRVLGLAGIVGSALLLADARLNQGLQFSISYMITNLSRIRAENFDSIAEGANRGMLGTLGGLLAPMGILCIIGVVRYGRRAGPHGRLLALTNLLLILWISLAINAGRALITNVALIMIVVLYLSRPRLITIKPRTIAIGALAAVSVWFFSTEFLASRTDDAGGLRILEQTQRATPRGWIEPVDQDSQRVALALVSVGYFASPIPAFHYYLSAGRLPGPFYGGYSFPLPARAVGTAAGTWGRTTWIDIRGEVFAPFETTGYFGNVWTTWLRDVLVDFGYAGALAFCLLFGMLMAAARNTYQARGSLPFICIEAIMCLTLGFGAFTSFMFDQWIACPFLIALAAAAWSRSEAQQANRPHPRRSASAAV